MAKHAKHGTVTMYRYGCRCDDCKTAKAKQRAEYTARKKSGNFVAQRSKKPKLPICEPLALCMARDFNITRIAIAEVFGCDATTITLRLSRSGYKPGKGSNNPRADDPIEICKGHRKRAKRYGVVYESGITLQEVYKRDNGTCYICGCKTNKSDEFYTADGYHVCGDTYPTIDHVLPMSRGGGHTWENVRLACFRCNTLKGAKLPDAEMA